MSGNQTFDFSIDLLQLIFWQYDSPSDANIAQLVQQKQAALTDLQETFWNDWQVNVFNIDTLDDFGVAVWAYILDVPLLQIGPPGLVDINFGFSENLKGFETSNFGIAPSGASNLTLEQKRIALKFKYRLLTTRGSVTEINQILKDLLSDTVGLVFIEDDLDMTINYVFPGDIPSWVEFIAINLDLFPTPQCVSFELVAGS